LRFGKFGGVALSTVREITYEVLRKLEMTVIFGNPGSTDLPFLRDMPADFRYVLGLHERSAAGMALGFAMARGKAAFVNLHSIASAGNGLSAIIDAAAGHVPLVITTGQQDRRQVLAEPFLVSCAVDVVKPYVKWACEPLRAEDVPAAIVRGYHLAMQAPMGPVFISIPMDDWTHECRSVDVREVHPTVLAHPAGLDAVVRALDGSRNPAIVAGSQIEEDHGWEEVVALAEHLNVDVYQEPIAPIRRIAASPPMVAGVSAIASLAILRCRSGAPANYEFGLDDDFFEVGLLGGGVDALQNGLRREHTHLPERLPDRREPGVLKRRALNVVEADDGNILGNAPACFAQGLDGADRGDVVECKQCREWFAGG
jgi:benzoylformate decarboxylase